MLPNYNALHSFLWTDDSLEQIPMRKPTREPRHSEDVRQALLRAAAHEFLRAGHDGATVREIASLAGVTTGSLYHFFGGKEGLFEELIRDVFLRSAAQADAMAARTRSTSPTSAALRLSLELGVQIQQISTHAHLAQLYAVAHGSSRISAQILTLATSRFADLLRQVVAPDRLAALAYTLAVTAKSLIMGLVQERLLRDELTWESRLDLLLRALWAQWTDSGIPIERLRVDVLRRLRANEVGDGGLSL